MFNVVHSKYHINNGITHYETGFKPTGLSIDELRRCAFTPTVFRSPNPEEYREIFLGAYNRKISSKKPSLDYNKVTPQQYIESRLEHLKPDTGYRAYEYVIGLLDHGYVDIDGVKPNSIGDLPTIANVHNAMTEQGLYNIVFQSASVKPGKLRLIYKRSFKLYLDGVYDETSDLWSLTYPKSRKIICTNTAFPLHLFSKSLKVMIAQIISQETAYIGETLASAGLNTSGIDLTACKAHMHSKHCMVPDTVYDEPQYFTDGATL